MPRGEDTEPSGLPAPESKGATTDHAVIVARVNDFLKRDPVASMVAHRLSELGGEVYVVGGAVRDAAAGRDCKDVDLVCRGLALDDIAKNLKDAAADNAGARAGIDGARFPVVRYAVSDGGEVEVALPRREVSTGPGRDDWEVSCEPDLPMTDDMARRDFTVNAMAVNIDTGELIDPHGGVEDIKRGRLRTVSPDSFRDESLRILRAVTIHARMGLEPDEETKAQMRKYAPELSAVTDDTARKELDNTFKAQNPAAGMRLAQETGVLAQILPEMEATVGFDQRNPHHNELLFDHMVTTLDRISKLTDDPDLRLAGFMHDVGKVESQSIKTTPVLNDDGSPVLDDNGKAVVQETGHYYKRVEYDESGENIIAEYGKDHDEEGARIVNERLSKLNYPVARRKKVAHYVRHHMFTFGSPQKARRFMKRVGEEHVDGLLNLRIADQGAKDGEMAKIKKMISLIEDERKAQNAFTVKKLALRGSDVMKELDRKNPDIDKGVKGPIVGNVLNALLERVLEDPSLNNPDSLVQIIDDIRGDVISQTEKEQKRYREIQQEKRRRVKEAAKKAAREAKKARLNLE